MVSPTPGSLRKLTGTPPAYLITREDVEAIAIIEGLGEVFCKPEDEIIQAKNLASGLSDIVVLLERPHHRRDHKFNVSVEDFVKNFKTLSAVDELIRFATKGTRSIHDVTVVNVYSFQPDKFATQNDKECHEAVAKILKAKKPKVILRCHREEYWDQWLELPARHYQLRRKKINIVEEYTTIVLQSFHP